MREQRTQITIDPRRTIIWLNILCLICTLGGFVFFLAIPIHLTALLPIQQSTGIADPQVVTILLCMSGFICLVASVLFSYQKQLAANEKERTDAVIELWKQQAKAEVDLQQLIETLLRKLLREYGYTKFTEAATEQDIAQTLSETFDALHINITNCDTKTMQGLNILASSEGMRLARQLGGYVSHTRFQHHKFENLFQQLQHSFEKVLQTLSQKDGQIPKQLKSEQLFQLVLAGENLNHQLDLTATALADDRLPSIIELRQRRS